MKVVVLNGSPKGDVSVTMQYVAYLRKKFPEHSYEIINAAQRIGTMERDAAAFETICGSVRSANLVIWAFPLYYLLVCSQYKRFIELIFERGAREAFAGKYAISLSTSIHFFDQTAHAYVRAISDDLGMNYLGAFSAEMHDLLKEEERRRLGKFAAFAFSAVETNVPAQPANAPLVPSAFSYVPGRGQKTVPVGAKKIVVLTDDDGTCPNLTAMVARIRAGFSGTVAVVSLHDLDIRGGCLGCCQCGYDNTCVYTDGYVDFFTTTLVPADIIIMAGTVHDRYLSSTWKQFFDRSFFQGHTPGLNGKQIGFVIAGPLRQIPCLKEALTGWADNGGCHAHFVTDEVTDSLELDALLDAMAQRLVAAADLSYIPPKTFYAVGGHKIFRDNIYAGMRFAFPADYRYYREHGMFDFPQADAKTRLFNALFIPLTRIPALRRKIFADMKRHMVEPFAPVLEKA